MRLVIPQWIRQSRRTRRHLPDHRQLVLEFCEKKLVADFVEQVLAAEKDLLRLKKL